MHHENQLSGRYITTNHIAPLLNKLPDDFKVKALGKSVQNKTIYSVKIGTGKTRILLWSQMHGNESTTTKAIFDLFLAFQSEALFSELSSILETCTLCFVPILNPDGAANYTRENANDIDLNRDAQSLSQPESVILKDVYREFVPDYCFNLHGQRTIYGFEATGKPSVLSFLAPAADEQRRVTLSRKRAMSIITHIQKTLETELPGQIGRYDDGYNHNCVGDTFQSLETPTILFEAGHASDDYDREQTRYYIFKALIGALQAIVSSKTHDIAAYLAIPEHQKCFCDIKIIPENGNTVSVQYQERLEGDKISFVPVLSDEKETSGKFSHKTIKVKGSIQKIVYEQNESSNTVIAHFLLDNGITITL